MSSSNGLRLKLRVNVKEIRAALTDERRVRVSAFQAEKKAYPAKLAKWRATAAKKLQAEARKIERNGHKGGNKYVDIGYPPTEPKLDTSVIDRRLSLLKMTTEESIVLSEEDAACLLGR